MIILNIKDADRKKANMDRCPGDIIDIKKFNNLPGPVIARMLDGSEYWIETLDVQTGSMRIDVCGKIDFNHFSEVILLIDQDGNEHHPDNFWLD